MHHFFVENKSISETEGEFCLQFSDLDAAHIKAQRLRVGEHISVVDASSDYFEVELTQISKEGYFARIAQKLDALDPNFSMTLFQAVPKGSKAEDVLRGATEIGIDEFCLVDTERSVSKIADKANKKIARFESVARSASMQSGRTSIPNVAILDFNNALDHLKDFDIVFLFWEETCTQNTIKSALYEHKNKPFCVHKKVAIFIGAEGGISAEEVKAIKAANQATYVCTLGDTILRTETAGIVAPALVKYELTRGE